jgi:hypothetical protein
MTLMNPPASRLGSKYAFFILGIAFLVYAQTIRFPFLGFDDKGYIVNNPSVHHYSTIGSSFLPTVVSDPYRQESLKVANFYRPLVGLWIVLNYKLFGLHAWLWRIAALVTYSFGVWLFWRVAYKLTRDDFTAFGAALLFALHPLHVEGVAWLSGACVELPLCVFFLGGFLGYLLWRETANSRWLLLCSILVLFSLWTKETGAALPVLIVAHAWMFRSKENSEPKMRAGLLGTALLVPISLYIFLRVLAIKGVVLAAARHHPGEVLATIPLFFTMYLVHALWPVHLTVWYNFQILTNLSFANFWLPLLLCMTYVCITLWAIIRKPLLGFLLLWWALLLIPALVGMMNFVDTEYMHDRFTFIGLGGFCILAASTLRRLPETGRKLFGFPAVSVAALALIITALGSLSTLLAFSWRNDFAMAVHAVQASPTVVRPRILLGNELQKKHDRKDALSLYRDTLKLDPNRWETLFAYGTALANDGDRDGAIKVLSYGLEVAPSKSVFYLILSDILADAGRFDDASRLLESGISRAEEPELLRGKLAHVQALQHGAGSNTLH